jgi:hypothetical protein
MDWVYNYNGETINYYMIVVGRHLGRWILARVKEDGGIIPK